MIRRSFIIIIALLLSACNATIPLASYDNNIKAKSFSVPNNKSNIYVVRSCEYGQKLHEVVLNNGARIALACHTYFLFVVNPGDHSISVYSTENRDVMTITTQVNKNYFVKMGWRMGSGTGDVKATVKLMDEMDGKTAIQKSQLVSSEGYY